MLLYLHIMDSFIDLSILGSNYANLSHVPLAELLNSWRSRRRFCWHCSLLGVFHWLFKRLLPLSQVTHLRTTSSKEGVWWVTTSASRHKHLVAESAKNTTDSCIVEPDEIDSIRILRLPFGFDRKTEDDTLTARKNVAPANVSSRHERCLVARHTRETSHQVQSNIPTQIAEYLRTGGGDRDRFPTRRPSDVGPCRWYW